MWLLAAAAAAAAAADDDDNNDSTMQCKFMQHLSASEFLAV